MTHIHRALSILFGLAAGALIWAGCVADDAVVVPEPVIECHSPGDCPGEDGECERRSCADNHCGRAPVPERSPCDEDGGRMCNGQGACVECVGDPDCAAAGLACVQYTCIEPTCTDEVVNGSETDVDCGGDCLACPNGNTCLEGSDCESRFCQPSGGELGTCAPCVDDDDCAPFLCDGGTGSCTTSCVDDEDCDATGYCAEPSCLPKNPEGVACTANNQCDSGFCADGVCCDSACTGACEACHQPTAGICTVYPPDALGSPSCSPYLCDGLGGDCPSSCSLDEDCTSQSYCDGASCQAKKPQGGTCAASNECASNPCVDGYCCNTICSNSCDACNVSGQLGTCRPRPDNSPGDPGCDPYLCNGSITTCPATCVTALDCIAGHYCGGSPTKHCLPLKLEGAPCGGAAECQSTFCIDGYCCNTACGSSCDRCNLAGNLGTCTLLFDGLQGTPSCSPYLCDGVSATCPTSCASAADCVNPSTYYCDGNAQCAVKKANGSSCGSAVECTSNFCADGYCCNTACGSSCDQCNQTGAEGFCLPAPPGAAGDPSCSPYVCSGGGAGCPTSCVDDTGCAAGFVCNGSDQCVAS